MERLKSNCKMKIFRRKDPSKEPTLDEWNEMRQAEYESWNSFPKKSPVKCPKCRSDMLDQYHVDYNSGPPARRQVICTNPKCIYVGYRLLGADDCHKQCAALNVLIKKKDKGDE
jgi:hypothetical protein